MNQTEPSLFTATSLGELNNGSTSLVLTSNATIYCSAVTDTIVIQYLDTPTIDAGTSIEVCIDTTFIQLDATVQFSTNTLWSTNGGGTFDDDGIRHSTKVAWRALANLQKELEETKK